MWSNSLPSQRIFIRSFENDLNLVANKQRRLFFNGEVLPSNLSTYWFDTYRENPIKGSTIFVLNDAGAIIDVYIFINGDFQQVGFPKRVDPVWEYVETIQLTAAGAITVNLNTTYTHMFFVCDLKSSEASPGNLDTFAVQLNGTTSNHISSYHLFWAGGASSGFRGTTNDAAIGLIPSSSVATNLPRTFGLGLVWSPFYSMSGRTKMVNGIFGSANTPAANNESVSQGAVGDKGSSLGPMTSLVFNSETSDLAVGSKVTVYGIR